MAKILTLNQNRDFRRLYRRKGEVSSVMVTYLTRNRLGKNRVGITTSKKIGKAHHRNRARRVIREAYRLMEPSFDGKSGWDIVFVARTRTCTCTMQEVFKTMKRHLTSLTADA